MNTKPRITRKLADAIDALLSGEAKTQKDAAQRAGMRPEQLSRALKKPHVQEHVDRAIRTHFNGLAKLAATARMSKLIDAGSEQVAFNAADRVLRITGVGGESERAMVGGGIALQIVFKHHRGEQPAVIDAPKQAVYITDQSGDGN